ncbi:MAG: hypothetical protein FD167_1571 [bacterium]|nr:MAG: hypothetical protein FD167_1571 [bacterium]
MNNSNQRNASRKTTSKVTQPLFYVLFIVICLSLLFLTSNQLFNSTLVQANSPSTSTVNKAQDQPQVLADAGSLPQTAQQQIAAVIAEKNSRTPQQRKSV